MKTTIFTTEEGDKIRVDNNLWIAIKTADSYYSSSIPNKYHHGMHDTRGVVAVFQSEGEARQKMNEWAADDLNLHHEDDETIKELYGTIPDWYEGEGYYRNEQLFNDVDVSDQYEYDLRYYKIRPLVDELARMEDRGSLWELAQSIERCGYVAGFEIIEYEEVE